MASQKLAPVVLAGGERARLAAWANDPQAPPLALRARIVLACAAAPPDLPAGQPVSRVAAELGLSRDTVRKWRSRFLAQRLAGLRDAPRPGAPRTITDEQVARVIARTLLEAPPAGRARWSTRLMAAETGMSQSAVSRVWRLAGSRRARAPVESDQELVTRREAVPQRVASMLRGAASPAGPERAHRMPRRGAFRLIPGVSIPRTLGTMGTWVVCKPTPGAYGAGIVGTGLEPDGGRARIGRAGIRPAHTGGAGGVP